MGNTLRLQGATFLFVPDDFAPAGWKWRILLTGEARTEEIISDEIFSSRIEAKKNMENNISYLIDKLSEMSGGLDRQLDVIHGGLDS